MEINGIGDLFVEEIYEYYDLPILFLAIDIFSHKYLIMQLSESDNNNERWMCMKISDNRIEALKGGNMSLRSVFQESENGSVLILEGLGFTEKIPQVEYILSDNIDEFDLPLEEYNFIVDQTHNTQFNADDLVLESQQRHREMFYLRLSGNGATPGMVSGIYLGGLLQRFQGTMDAIGLSIQQVDPEKKNNNTGKIPDFITQQTQLNPVGIFNGSLGIKYASANDVGLINEGSLLKQSYEKLSNIINSNSDNIQVAVGELKYRAINKMQQLFNHIASSPYELDLGYVFSGTGVQSTTLNNEKAEQLGGLLDQLKEKTDEIIEVSGVLDGIVISSKDFSIKDDEGELYKGKIDESIIDNDEVTKARIGKRYIAQIEINHLNVSTSEYRQNHTLKGISYETPIR